MAKRATRRSDATETGAGTPATETGADVPGAGDGDAGRPPSEPPAPRDVTFRIPVGSSSSAALVGDFNAWSTDATPMSRSGDSFEVTIPLPPGEYRYRYLLDGVRWENDWRADAYVPNQFGTDDSLRRV